MPCLLQFTCLTWVPFEFMDSLGKQGYDVSYNRQEGFIYILNL